MPGSRPRCRGTRSPMGCRNSARRHRYRGEGALERRLGDRRCAPISVNSFALVGRHHQTVTNGTRGHPSLGVLEALMRRMKLVKWAVLSAMAAAPLPASADTVTFDFSSVFSGAAPAGAGPWLT